MSDASDHDLQIEMSTNVKWICNKLDELCDRGDSVDVRVGGLELWQAEMIGLEIPKRLDTHNERLKATENTDWMMRGIGALLVLILSLVGIGRYFDLRMVI